jgi:hypothetical protein
MVSFGLLIGGGVVLGVNNAFRDEQGFYATGAIPVQANSSAIVSQSANIQFDPGWFRYNRNAVTIRVEASSLNTGKPIFVGIAPETDLTGYLRGASYDEVTDIRFNPQRVNLLHHAGNVSPAAPTSQTFWVASASGSGTQTLQWNVTSGNYSLVVMNADGSSPVNSDVSLGVKIPDIASRIGWGLLIGGIVILIIGGVMLFFAVHGW